MKTLNRRLRTGNRFVNGLKDYIANIRKFSFNARLYWTVSFLTSINFQVSTPIQSLFEGDRIP